MTNAKAPPTAKPKAKPKAKAKPASSVSKPNANARERGASLPDQVIIRMYNVGFGDAFLVTLPSSPRPRRMLIDCGSIAAGPHPMKDMVKRIIEDVTDDDGVARIDIVVGTHRHRDHVSGFANAAWDDVEVGEVWLPWTEHPKDPRARRIRNQQARLALHLSQSLEASAGDEKTDERYQMALNALSNEDAMATLHGGFAGGAIRRFLPTSEGDDGTLRTDVFPGVTFHIVGPSFSDEVIREMDPPVGQSYMALVGDGSPGLIEVPKPFADIWWTDDGDLSREERKEVEECADDLGDAALMALEQAVNGTSLFFVMQVGKANLVFPGDAQWGTWKAALARPEVAAMLKATRFYKIGHHGSHNATPLDFVEQLDSGVHAMASVRPMSKWPEIPREPLLEALAERSGLIARSDKLQDVPSVFLVSEDESYVETLISIK